LVSPGVRIGGWRTASIDHRVAYHPSGAAADRGCAAVGATPRRGLFCPGAALARLPPHRRRPGNPRSAMDSASSPRGCLDMTGAPSSTRWPMRVRWALLATAALVLVVHSLAYNFVTDDAYISFVYSR